jgi:hypothetical protein
VFSFRTRIVADRTAFIPEFDDYEWTIPSPEGAVKQ